MAGRELSSFLGANTSHGFFGFFEELQNPSVCRRLFLIKGGPGSGKSTLIRKIGEEGLKKGHACEWIYCGSDPHSLDGVIFDGGQVAVVDATAPHILNPKYPGAFEEVIDLSFLFDIPCLQEQREQIVALSDENAALHRKTASYLAAAAILKGENLRISERFLNRSKTEAYAKHFLPKKAGNREGVYHKRFLSAVSGEGVIVKSDHLSAFETLIGVEDRVGGGADAFLQAVLFGCLAAGVDVYAYYCPLTGGVRLEHLLMPQLSLGFLTLNRHHPFGDISCRRVIHADRFYDKEGLAGMAQRLRFYEKAIGVMMQYASTAEREAAVNHKQLEMCYYPCMKFKENREALAKIQERVLSALA